MENKEFKNRVYGAVILKSINSNFNADFTHHPRTLPDGVVYSTDKALKYTIKDYFRKINNKQKLFYIKRFNNNLNPLTLDETYVELFGDFPENKNTKDDKEEIMKKEVLRNLLTCLDVRLFGATFAGKTNISLHGPVQINHGINKFPENDIYTEDILSPFRNPGKEGANEKGMSTIGNQTNLKEGYYVFHFSINPKNTEEFYEMLNTKKNDNEKMFLSDNDIKLFKNALNKSVTVLDSSRKIGTENEATIWIKLIENSIKIIPSLTELIAVEKKNNKIQIDVEDVYKIIKSLKEDIEVVEIFYNPITTKIIGLSNCNRIKLKNIITDEEITS
ncbi:MAG: CRISPR-associated protein [Ignavibacteriae bacterium]|nr:MAG: CRISPR-associated protein [Ignavibacteriota bacterium]